MKREEAAERKKDMLRKMKTLKKGLTQVLIRIKTKNLKESKQKRKRSKERERKKIDRVQNESKTKMKNPKIVTGLYGFWIWTRVQTESNRVQKSLKQSNNITNAIQIWTRVPHHAAHMNSETALC